VWRYSESVSLFFLSLLRLTERELLQLLLFFPIITLFFPFFTDFLSSNESEESEESEDEDEDDSEVGVNDIETDCSQYLFPI